MKLADADTAKQLAEILQLLHGLHTTALTDKELADLKAAAESTAERLRRELAADGGDA